MYTLSRYQQSSEVLSVPLWLQNCDSRSMQIKWTFEKEIRMLHFIMMQTSVQKIRAQSTDSSFFLQRLSHAQEGASEKHKYCAGNVTPVRLGLQNVTKSRLSLISISPSDLCIDSLHYVCQKASKMIIFSYDPF